MRLLILMPIIFTSACSYIDELDSESLSFEFSKELISSHIEAKHQISNHLNSKKGNTIFLESWVSMIKTTKRLNKKLLVEITEHQPIASLEEGKFLTQEGKIILPGAKSKELELIRVIGSDSEAPMLIKNAFLLQNILNIIGNSIVSIEQKSSDFLEAIDNEGKTYSFTEGDFRVQLERLEEFILFELNSGNMDHIRYMDLRYKNAIAVSYNKMEKST